MEKPSNKEKQFWDVIETKIPLTVYVNYPYLCVTVVLADTEKAINTSIHSSQCEGVKGRLTHMYTLLLL